jgi:glycosyltransferase involved in cell wall biosynthesis
LRRKTAVRAELVLLGGGPLVEAYREVVPTTIFEVGRLRANVLKAFERSVDKLTRRDPHIPARLPRISGVRRIASVCGRADLLYVNSFAAAYVLNEITPRSPVILHLHEMPYLLRYAASRSPMPLSMNEDQYIHRTLGIADTVLVPSEASRNQVLGDFPSIRDRCRVIPELIDVKSLRNRGRAPEEVRTEHGIPSGSLVVVACGSFDWRKANDLFVQVAARVIPAIRTHPVYFLWVGAPSEPALDTAAWLIRKQFDFEVQSLGLGDRIILVPPTPEVAAYIDAADLFLLPSREDPFPLVAIEAAALGKPVVCFDSSGTAEMVAGGAGVAVPHLDILAMSAAVRRFLEDSQARRSAGAIAAKRAEAYDVSQIAPRLLTTIEGLVQRRTESARPPATT